MASPNTAQASTMEIGPADIATVQSPDGIYYWGVASFYGDTSEARTFTTGATQCQ